MYKSCLYVFISMKQTPLPEYGVPTSCFETPVVGFPHMIVVLCGDN